MKQKTVPPKKNSAQTKRIPGPKPGSRIIWVSIAILVISVLAVYSSATRNGFTNWDDPEYVTENHLIRSLDHKSIDLFFTTKSAVGNYHPLTLLSLAIDYKSAYNPKAHQLDAAVFHRTNVIFHIFNTILVFLFIYILLKKKWFPALFVALIFAVHPMHVESVAWISERKDVLYVFFFLLALIAYLKYLYSAKYYWLALAFIAFLASSLSKAVAVTLPIVLIMIDYYSGKDIGIRRWIEKVPFLTISVYVGLMAIQSQSAQGAISTIEVMPLYYRIVAGSYGFFFYIVKFFAPLDLSAYYPYPVFFLHRALDLPFYYHLLPWVVLILIISTALLLRKNKDIVFGLAFYIITMVLVLQFFTVGSAIVAERYSYLPYIGLALAVYAGFGYLVQKFGSTRFVFAGIAVAFILLLMVKTTAQVKIWKNNETLWTNVIKLHPDAEIAYKNRGNYYAREANELAKAMKDYEILMQMGTKDAGAWSNIGNIYGLNNDFVNAGKAYAKSIRYDPLNPKVYHNRGNIYAQQKIFDSAFRDYDKALQLDPGNIDILKSRTYALFSSGDYPKAIEDYTILISKTDDNLSFYMNRGISYVYIAQYQNAVNDFLAVVKTDTRNKDAWMNLSQCTNKLGNKKQALEFALKAKENGMPVDNNYLESLK